MPLSEDEERILQEIAQRFYEDDPSFAREVSETTLYRHTVGRMKWAVVGLVAGAVFLVATLSTSYWLSFIGFVCMLGSALLFERNLRKLGRAGLDQLSKSVRANGLREALGAAARLTGFSLASLKASGWGPLPAILETLKGAGLQEIVDAPVDLVDPSDVQAASDLGLGVGALSVQRPFEAGRVALVLRLREFPTVRPGRAAVAPLAREQSVAAPTTGYHDVRLVALARLALPDTRVIEVDWQQYGPKLAQVALTFGANHLDRVSIEDDAALGRRRCRGGRRPARGRDMVRSEEMAVAGVVGRVPAHWMFPKRRRWSSGSLGRSRSW